MLFKLAFRNVLRYKKRNLFIIIMLAGGYFLSSFFIALSDGTYRRIITAFTSAALGHLQIHKKGFFEEPSIFKLIKSPEKIQKEIKKIKGAESSLRLYSSALLFTEKEVLPVVLIGIEPEKEVTTLCKGIIKGRFLTEGRKEIVISEKLAQVLNITSGKSVAILSQGFDGSLANDLFEVVGIFKTSGAGIGEEIACIPFKVMKNFLSIPYGAHEIVVLFQDYRKTSQFLSEMKKWNMSDLEILPWYKVAIEFYKGMQADRKGMWLSLLVVLFIISLGVLNTLLMAVLERTREFGLLKALGTSSEFLIALIYTEAFLLLFAGILSGFILAYPCNLFFSIFGIAYPEAIKMGGIEIKKMYTDLTFNSFFLPAIALFFSTLIVCIWPALRILKILPIEALKKI